MDKDTCARANGKGPLARAWARVNGQGHMNEGTFARVCWQGHMGKGT